MSPRTSAGKTSEQMNAEEQATRDALPIVQRCGHCDWVFDGPAGSARAAWVDHVTAKHPWVRLKQSRLSAKASDEVARDEAMVIVGQRAQAAVASEQREEEIPMETPTPPPAAAVRDFPCKADGCTKRTTLNRGRWAYTCPEHRSVGNPSPERRGSSPKKTKGSASNGKVNGKSPRDRLQVLRDLVVAEQDLINARVHVAQLEESFNMLAAEFTKAAA